MKDCYRTEEYKVALHRSESVTLPGPKDVTLKLNQNNIKGRIRHSLSPHIRTKGSDILSGLSVKLHQTSSVLLSGCFNFFNSGDLFPGPKFLVRGLTSTPCISTAQVSLLASSVPSHLTDELFTVEAYPEDEIHRLPN